MNHALLTKRKIPDHVNVTDSNNSSSYMLKTTEMSQCMLYCGELLDDTKRLMFHDGKTNETNQTICLTTKRTLALDYRLHI